MRVTFFWLILILSSIQHVYGTHVIVSGGPALKRWEHLRIADDRHDRWWANFIRAATLQMDLILKDPTIADKSIIWFVPRASYQTRSKEDGKPYLQWISEVAAKRNAKLIWISSSQHLIHELNALPKNSVAQFHFFGHSNKYAFMLDYSNDILAASTNTLHENDLHKINRNIFRKKAICKSWGCHTGESMSAVWKKKLKIPLVGALGKTLYTQVGIGKLPFTDKSWTH